MFFFWGGTLGHLDWPFNPPKKTQEAKHKPKKTTHTTEKTKETQYNKNRNQNITTWFVKQQQQQEQKRKQKFKTNKRKGQHKRIRVLKANLKNLQKNSVFWNITTKFLQQNLIEDIKNTNVHN